MGSSAERKKIGDTIRARKAATRSISVAADGSASGGGGGSGRDRQAELVVPLVRINREVQSRSKVGDSVRLDEGGGGLSVLTRSGRIGEIPPGYLEKVRTGHYSGGIIIEMRSEPVGVKVSLS